MAAKLVATFFDKEPALGAMLQFQQLFVEASESEQISLYAHVPNLLVACSDKRHPVATQAASLVQLMYETATPWSGGFLLPLLRTSLSSAAKPATKIVACDLVTAFAAKFPQSVALEIEWLVHPLGILMKDIKAPVRTAARHALTAIIACSGNGDLVRFGPTIIKALESVKDVVGCVEELSVCILTQRVEAPTVSVLTPVLVRGLSERNEQTKRQCCVIVENMCKLIDDARVGSPLLAEVR
jgi:elongation factor 3